jgi:hypothetical protein
MPHCFLGGITLSYLARIFGFWPFSVGHSIGRPLVSFCGHQLVGGVDLKRMCELPTQS